MTTDKNDKTMFAMRISKDEKMQLKGLFQDIGLILVMNRFKVLF